MYMCMLVGQNFFFITHAAKSIFNLNYCTMATILDFQLTQIKNIHMAKEHSSSYHLQLSDKNISKYPSNIVLKLNLYYSGSHLGNSINTKLKILLGTIQ